MMIIQNNAVAYINYLIKDTDGNIIENNFDYTPEPYLHGASNLLPMVEKVLAQKQEGELVEVMVPSQYAYGNVNQLNIYSIPIMEIEEGASIEKGAYVLLKNGKEGLVKAISNETVLIDLNHPLAGKDLYFTIKVASVRAASESEILNGYPSNEAAMCCGGSGCC